MSIEAMKLALEALEYLDVTAEHYVDDRIAYAAITALRQAIEQAQKQEPVMWMSSGEARIIHWKSKHPGFGDDWVPLYTSPPPRQPLTDEQIKAVIATIDPAEQYLPAALRQFARAIEAAHGITKENT